MNRQDRTRRTGGFLLMLSAIFATAAPAEPLKVDLSYPNRNDTASPGYVEWAIGEGPSASREFDGVTITFEKISGGPNFKGDWFKGGVEYDARMVTDGLTGLEGGAVRMIITGLDPGKHSLVTYHNTFGNPANNTFGKIDIALDGAPAVSGLVPTNRVLDNYGATSAHFDLDAAQGKPITLEFVCDGSGSNNNVTINGFEIDTANPLKAALKPKPANRDEHAAGDAGSLVLSWTPAQNAVSHEVYLGDSSESVFAATPDSAEFKGAQPAASFTATGLSPSRDYFWRVDEIDAQGVKTRGELWRFRLRHRAFPTAEGYGQFAQGGRGGRVIEVTNLDDSGPGSLRAAIEAEGPRTVIFRVSGLIKLTSKLILRNPYCTVAGQTAPGEGICLSNYNFGLLGGHDQIVRFVRVRPGNTSGKTLDGMGMASADNSIIDHCSISWTLDEAFSSRNAKNITLQHTLISEALNQAGHKKYAAGKRHGFAASIGGDIGSFHHNLLAHCAGRNWSLAGGMNRAGELAGRLDIRNNVVYNWEGRTTDGGAAEVNFVANYYKPGPAFKEPDVINPQFESFDPHKTNPCPQRYYIEGNVMEGHYGASQRYAGVDPQPDMPIDYFTVPTPFFDPMVATATAGQAYEDVLANVGCNRPSLDSHDRRVIEETRSGSAHFRGSKTGIPGLPDSQDDVGGWPSYPRETRPAGYDTDHDGMPNAWENARAWLNPANAEDRNADHDGDGYTNLEEYLNHLAGDEGNE